MTKAQQREMALKYIINEILWQAARYAHGRHTFAPSIIRDTVKTMQRLYPDWKPKKDHVIEPPEKDEVGGMSFREDYLDDIFNPAE